MLNIIVKSGFNSKILLIGLLSSLFFAIFFLFLLIRPDFIAKFAKKLENTKFMLIIEKKINKKNLSGKIINWTLELKNSIALLWKKNFLIMIFDILLCIFQLILQPYAMYYLFIKILEINMNFLDFSLIYYLVFLISFYIPTPGASGGIESVFILVFLDFFANKEKIALVIFIWRLTTYYLQIFFQIILLMIYLKFKREAIINE